MRLAFEKEMLGLYLSDHPLKGVESALARHVDATIAELREGGRDGEMRWVGGVVTGVARKYTKRGELMATFVLEDLVSSIEVWVFPRTMTEVAHLLADDSRGLRQGPARPARGAGQAGVHGDQAAGSQPRPTSPSTSICPSTPSPTSGWSR